MENFVEMVSFIPGLSEYRVTLSGNVDCLLLQVGEKR
jgi:hypothetical protein